MELTSTGNGLLRARSDSLVGSANTSAIASWILAFSLVAYLALSNGGYDTVVRSQAGIAVWWIVLIGALAGIIPAARLRPTAWIGIGLLAGLTVWTGLASGWSESAERSVVELGRLATYLGVLVLAIAVQGRAAARHTINGLACAIGLVTVLAVLSRLHPQAFPTNDHLAFLSADSSRKLSYPLNYWNALAAFAAIGVPLLTAIAVAGRTLVGQALAAATLPLSALCMYFTVSRGGALALALGLVVFLVLAPMRLRPVGTLLVAGIGAAILISAASQRDALQAGAQTASAIGEGNELLWLTFIVCAGVASLQVAAGLAARHLTKPAWLAPGRGAMAIRTIATLTIAVIVAVAAGAPTAIDKRWQEFKAPPGTIAASDQGDVFSRLQTAEGTGRYQFWSAALHAQESSPWKGIGPGTFEYWWARTGTLGDFVRDAHSLYFETLAETGLIGLALLACFLALLAGVAVVRSLREPRELRLWIAAAASGLTVFLVSAALDWVWEMAAIAVVVLALGSVIIAGRDDTPPVAAAPEPSPRVLPRAVLALLAIVALGAVAVPMAGALAANASRAAASDGRLADALERIQTAERLQPYAATPRLQRALVLEAAGALDVAAPAARAATRDEPTNWRTWLVLARVEAKRGRATSAVRALREARRLNPRSTVFAK